MAMSNTTDAGGLTTIMQNYAVLLGLREREALALARSIADGTHAPKNEREALSRVEHAVLDPADADGSDRALIATWLSGQDADRDPTRLPQGKPVATGLIMSPQSIEPVSFGEMVQALGSAIGARGVPARQPVRVTSRAR
jgi:hypothetical protein